MVQMAHHRSGSTPHNQQQPSFLAARQANANFPEVTRRELAPLSPEEMISYNREMAKARENEAWIARQKNFEMRNDPKRSLGPNEEVRKQDAYYRASQEYMRLMNEEPSNRQTFREKQRLTEDLEKQKRLLIEDLARDQQMKQDKYNRNHVPPPAAYHNDVRTMHYVNESAPPPPPNSREAQLSLRLKPEVSAMYPFDARYPPQHLASSEDIQHYRRIQEKMMKLGKLPLQQNRQCLHSDFRRYPQELGSIIQEKEKKLKEMEEKIVKLEHEEKIQFLKRMGATGPAGPPPQVELENREPYLPKMEPSSLSQQPNTSYRYSSISSPPKSTPLIQNELSPTSTTSKIQLLPTSSTASAFNSTSNSEHKELLANRNAQEKVKDNNNNTTAISPLTSSSVHVADSKNSGKIEPVDSPILNSNSSHEDLVIDEKQEDSEKQNKIFEDKETSQTITTTTTTTTLNRQDSDCIKLESSISTSDDNVTTEVVDDDKTFNVKYGSSQNPSPTSENQPQQQQQQENNLTLKSENINENTPQSYEENGEVDLDASGNRQKQKKKVVKPGAKRDENNSSPLDFQASQNRLALDLPGHNWLEKRLKQQNVVLDGGKPKEESITKSESVESHEQFRQRQDFPQDDPSQNNSQPIPASKESHMYRHESSMGRLTNNKDSTSFSEGISIPHIPVTVTSKLSEMIAVAPETKETPRSELLLKMLESEAKKPSPSTTTPPPSAAAVINLSHTVSTTSELVTALRSESKSSPQKSLIVVKDSVLTTSPAAAVSAGLPPSSSAMFMKPNHHNSQVSPRSTFEDRQHRHRLSTEGLPGAAQRDAPYQEVRPNLVLERRGEGAMNTYPPQTKGVPGHLSEATGDYNKYIIEERYNRKRPLEDLSKEEREIALRRAEFSERFFSDLERGMMSKNKVEQGVPHVDHKDRLHSTSSSVESVPPSMHRRSLDDPSNKERLTKIEGSDYNYLSKFRENRSPSMMYKPSDPLLKSPGSKSTNEYSTKRSLSPPHGQFRTPQEEQRYAMEKGLHRRGNSSDGIPPVLNGRFDSQRHFSQLHRRAESVDPLLLNNLQTRERELNLIEEVRRREEIHRSAMEASRKERMMSQSVPPSASKLHAPLHPSEEHLMNLNDKVRTVEDLRALQLGMPIPNGFHRYIRPQAFRNERLTEREKVALREADFIQASLRHDSIVSRQDIHNSYMKHARRKSSVNGYPPLNVKQGGPIAQPPPARPGFNEEHLAVKRQQEEEKMRAHHERIPLYAQEHREGFPHPKDVSNMFL